MAEAPTTSTTAGNADTSAASDSPHEDLLSALIGTYRELNLTIRPLAEAQLTTADAGTSIHEEIAHLREEEFVFAQTLKEKLTGVDTGVEEHKTPVTDTSSPDVTTAMLISQFGSARETTLSLLRGLDDAGWSQPFPDGKPLLDHVQALVARDKKHLDRILSTVKS
ncbi:MAG: DinB family protein [Thermomicrobiales bacterium]